MKVSSDVPYLESNFTGMKHCALNLALQSATLFRTLLPHLDQKQSRTIRDIMDNLLIPLTFNHLTLLTVKGWIGLGSILSAIYLEMQINERRSDFRCFVKNNIDKDFIRGKCFDQYQKKTNKLGVPVYAFIMVNVFVIPLVSVIYSQCVKSIVRELESRRQDSERRRSCRLFLAYFCQLVVSYALRIIFIAFLEIELFYPRAFPADFSCSIEGISVGFLPNQAKSVNSVHCFTQRAGDKNFWTETVKKANGIFAFFAFMEILWILSRARMGKKFMDNQQFYVDHLKSNADEQRLGQKDFHRAIQTLKKNCLRGTQQLSDLEQPFRRPNPGEGNSHDLTIDEIYVHVAIHEGRARQYFTKDPDRRKQLKEYPPDEKDCQFAKSEDIIDMEHKNVLVVGRPGIGKTSLSTKMLRLWAFREAFNVFNVVFLVKFRRFNDNAELSLRELLARAETVQRLDDSVWEFVQNESTKVLLIFDGMDEFSRKEDIIAQKDDPTNKNDVEEKMPVSVLYNKVATGQLLRGVSIVTTTRPTAVEYVAHVKFQRTVEILGFTSKNVKDYVEKFTRGVPGAKEKMWGHISSNINIFSLCYIPMNCFLICHCLLQVILYKSSQALPTKITDIYKMTVKMFFFSRNREGGSPKELEKLKSTLMYKPFEKFPKELQEIFNSLGEIAFKEIEEGRLLFESSEVSGLEDCGLLHKLPDEQPPPLSDKEPKSQFCFTHLTVQEFFAAKHLVDSKTDKEIEEFAYKNINDGTWQVVLQFVAGLVKSSSSNIFIKLLPKATEKRTKFPETERLTSWPATEDKHLAVQVCKCLYEINDEQQPQRSQSKIEKINFGEVSFKNCSLAPIDLAAVLRFLVNAEDVVFIDLSSNELGDLGAKEVKKFIVNRERKLKWLNLSFNKFTDKAAEDLAAALKHSNCKLKALSLVGNHLTDKAGEIFAVALKHSNCNLESLYLIHNNFTQKGHQYLTDAGKKNNCKVRFW